MSQNITLLGASYSAVPAVTLPKTGGGTATFTDVTDTTAGASDVASGKYFYTSSGVRTQGTGSGGSPTLQTITKTYTPTTSQQTETITASSGYDGIEEVDVTVNAMPEGSIGAESTAYVYTDSQNQLKFDLEYWGCVDTENEEGTPGYIPDETFSETKHRIYDALPSNITITPTESAQTVGGSNVMMQGVVTVNAIPSNYVGSGVTQRSSSDLTSSGATVTVPSGYYSAQATKSVSSGSATPASSISGTSATVSTGTNTLTLSKTVSNTPQVSAGYISSGTAGNSSVSLTASVTTKGTATITPGTSDQTISSGTYITGTQTISGDANLVAGNIKSGTSIFGVTGSYTGGGTSKNVQIVQGTTRTSSSTMTAIGAELTVSKAGTYDIYWDGVRSTTSGSYTYATQLYIDGTAYGSENSTWTNNIQNNHLTNVSLTANQKLRIRGRNSRNSSYYIYAPQLTIVEA